MDNAKIADILKGMGFLLDMNNENQFKVNAYLNAARAIEVSNILLTKSTTLKELQEIKGIGKSVATHIVEILNTGTFPEYEELKGGTASGFLEMLKIPGLGPKKIKKLHKELGVNNLEDLEIVCLQNEVECLEGFSFKTQENILKGIEFVKQYSNQYRYGDVIDLANILLKQIRALPNVKAADLTGSIRRGKEVIKDIDIVVAANETEGIMEKFVSFSGVKEIIAKGDTKSSVRLHNGIQVDLRVVSEEQFVYALMYFTGSKAHNIGLRTIAMNKGFKLNEYELTKDGKKVECATEWQVFDTLGVNYIPPELRENSGELEAEEIPELIKLEDLNGVLHVHTNWSDGGMTIEDAGNYALEKGWEFIGIADHSKAASYANGLDEARLEQQIHYVKTLNRVWNSQGLNVKILSGIEVDILKDGSLDLDESILSQLDYVIGAIHSGFSQDEELMTNRIVKAIQNPLLKVLAHPTGRLLLSREPYAVNLERIFDECVKHDVALEINSLPDRLDLDWRYCRIAKQKGVKFWINPDAHVISNFDFLPLGINVARKGWLTKADVLNTIHVL